MKASRLATFAAAAALLLSFGSLPAAAQAAAPEAVDSIKPIIAAPVARKTSHRAKTSTAKNEARVYLFRGLLNVFSLGMDELADKIKASGIPATVYNHTEWEEVAGKIAADYKNGNHAPIVLIGHSLGADAVMFMAAALGKQGVPVALVVPFDGTQTLVAPANVARVMNITQRDYAYARRGAGFRGELQNVDVSSQGVDHLNIDKSPRLHAMVLNKIVAVVKKGAVPAEFALTPGEAKERAKPAPKPETASAPADAAAKPHVAGEPAHAAEKPAEKPVEEKPIEQKPAEEKPVEKAVTEKAAEEKPAADKPAGKASEPAETAVKPAETPKAEEKPAAVAPAVPASPAAVTPSTPISAPISLPAATAPQAASAPAAKPIVRPATERLEYEKLPDQ
jgi:hypothetical protein